MDRRTLLRTGGTAALGMYLGGGCASRGGGSVLGGGAGPLLNLPRVQASWDRVIRTTVGLRPHRPSGFVVRAQRLDDATVIHNYGHGGAGHSLSWGTATLAADLAMDHPDRGAAVIGCGVVGLTTARRLQSRGFEVTVYAKALPPETTSNMALAAFTPTSGLIDNDRRAPEWEAQFERAAQIAYRELQLLAGSENGISWINTYSWSDRPPGPGSIGVQAGRTVPPLELGSTVLGPGEHPFPGAYARVRPTLRIEPSIYLNALMRDVLSFGGRIVVRAFDTPRDVAALDESLVFNCTGLGAGALFGDREMVPVKGQLTFLAPQPEVTYRVEGTAPGGGRVGVMPRNDGIALGHTMERAVSTLEPNEELMRRNVERAIALFAAMRPPDVRGAWEEPPLPSQPPPLESFYGLES